MGLNTNHTAEELNGVRCAIVEKNVNAERANFLAALLSGNGYEVHCVPAAPPKAKPAPAASTDGEVEKPTETPVEAPPSLFTVGVTDVTFNPINAVYGRLLRTKEGNIVTAEYWNQKSDKSRDDVPYFEARS